MFFCLYKRNRRYKLLASILKGNLEWPRSIAKVSVATNLALKVSLQGTVVYSSEVHRIVVLIVPSLAIPGFHAIISPKKTPRHQVKPGMLTLQTTRR
jgi:hypothetical protein